MSRCGAPRLLDTNGDFQSLFPSRRVRHEPAHEAHEFQLVAFHDRDVLGDRQRRAAQLREHFLEGLRGHADDDVGEIGRAHSELQSLMRISYAVFCLKKKIKKATYTIPLLTLDNKIIND